MGQFDSELTRKFLLNSNSRGCLDEVVTMEEEQQSESWLVQDAQEEQEGSDLTLAYFREYYN